MPILSVVIATHNRSAYAVHAAKSVLSINSPLIELVMHDTSTDGKLQNEIMPLLVDARLHYRHCATRLSMTENHNLALAMASGDYVCVVGDDDTVAAEILDAVQWAIEHKVDAISPKVVANYAWPDFLSKTFGRGHSSRLYINDFSSGIAYADCGKGLRNSLQMACQGADGLPKIYHGIVRRAIMEQVKAKTGEYFHGVSPDVSGALGIAALTTSFAEIDYPLTIPGAAGNSNTGRSAMNSHRGNLEDDPHIKPYKNLVWPPLIPRFFSVETVWGQAAYETLSKLDAAQLERFNFLHLYAICLVSHPDYYKEIFNAAMVYRQQYGRNAAVTVVRVLMSAARIALAKAVRLARRAMRPSAAGGRFFIPDIPNIHAASDALKAFLSKKSTSFKGRSGNV
ncbi:glycosyltransferase [Janthinobacterium sp.]|jgi:glycosyltransferase involved in cell wall biosynthesis|uniref:glycosyltransferase family 2 protein n=1 Tax=Janthinobacterium sp. TaxID=1871054 RepID=UPI002603CED0|nr:glycosyltransferase [Janthinobacterium sp.]